MFKKKKCHCLHFCCEPLCNIKYKPGYSIELHYSMWKEIGKLQFHSLSATTPCLTSLLLLFITAVVIIARFHGCLHQ